MTTTPRSAKRAAQPVPASVSAGRPNQGLDPIGEALAPRVSRGLVACEVRTLRRRARAIRDLYRGGLPAEVQSRDGLLEAEGLRQTRTSYRYHRGHSRPALRRLLLSLRGRRIDLVALLSQRRTNGQPLWSLVDPRRPIDDRNNGAWRWPQAALPAEVLVHGAVIPAGRGGDGNSTLVAEGMPVLPARVRQILTDPALARYRSRAKWMGVLYQPESWREVNPDPALVVEWTDLPGQYFALAVWGGDRARIMEWVS